MKTLLIKTALALSTIVIILMAVGALALIYAAQLVVAVRCRLNRTARA